MNSSEDSAPVVSRRDALKTFGASAVALAAAFWPARGFAADSARPSAGGAATTQPPAPTGPFTLPPLGYAYAALEPAIDAKTMEIHHTKHHQNYVNQSNIALKDQPTLAAMTAEQVLRGYNKVPGPIAKAVRNNVGGHANHTLFWDILTPGGPKMPGGSLASAIDRDFTSFDAFVRKLSEEALSRFGSGWAWLAMYNKKLSVISTANQDSPIMDGYAPILGIDVWEHAYYLNYQNRRADYLKAVLGLINWDRVRTRLDIAMKAV